MQHYLTKSGLDELKKEYEKLLEERPSAVLELKKAREMGDLSENGYYKAARSKLSGMDHRIRRLKRIVQTTQVIQTKSLDIIGLGNTVVLRNENDEFAFRIVGSLEASPRQNKISNISPIGKQLLGKKIGDKINFNNQVYLIKQIR